MVASDASGHARSSNGTVEFSVPSVSELGSVDTSVGSLGNSFGSFDTEWYKYK